MNSLWPLLAVLCLSFLLSEIHGGTISYTTPDSYDFTVPWGVTVLQVVISGASGTDSVFSGITSSAGLGRLINAGVPVTPSKFFKVPMIAL